MHPDLMLTILRQRLSVWKAVSSAIFGFLGPCIWTQPGDSLILGTKGGLRIPSTECWNGYGLDRPLIYYHDVGGAQVETVIPLQESNADRIFYEKVRAFVDAVQTGAPSPISSAQIIYNQAILDGIARSAALGREVDIVIPE